MCPDQESNQQPFGLRDDAQPLSHTSQGRMTFYERRFSNTKSEQGRDCISGGIHVETQAPCRLTDENRNQAPRSLEVNGFESSGQEPGSALAGVAQRVECQPANWKVANWIPSQVAGQVPGWGCVRGSSSMLLSHIDVSLPLSSPPLPSL